MEVRLQGWTGQLVESVRRREPRTELDSRNGVGRAALWESPHPEVQERGRCCSIVGGCGDHWRTVVG